MFYSINLYLFYSHVAFITSNIYTDLKEYIHLLACSININNYLMWVLFNKKLLKNSLMKHFTMHFLQNSAPKSHSHFVFSNIVKSCWHIPFQFHLQTLTNSDSNFSVGILSCNNNYYYFLKFSLFDSKESLNTDECRLLKLSFCN